MGIIVPIGEALVSHRWSLLGDNEQVISTYGIRPQTPGMSAVDMADAVLDAFGASRWVVTTNIVTGWTYRGFTLSAATVSGPVIVERPAAITGTLAGNSAPINCAMLFQKRTALGGRRNRGRMFFPPAYSDRATIGSTGSLLTSVVTENQTAATKLLADLVLEGVGMVVMHSTAPTNSEQVTQLIVADRIATQRRRMRP